MSDATETWDEEPAYDERIYPLMAQVIAICKERRIPLFASFAYKHTGEEGTSFCTTSLSFDGRRVEALIEANRLIRSRPAVFAITITGGGDREGTR